MYSNALKKILFKNVLQIFAPATVFFEIETLQDK